MTKFFLPIAAALMLMSCRPMIETEIVGQLSVDKRWGDLSFHNAKTGERFSLPNGQYRLTMPWAWPFTDPTIEIKNANGAIVGHFTVPRNNVKDDGTFEIFDRKEINGTNLAIMGGRRVLVLARGRYPKPNQSCTYTTTETVSDTCSDGKGRTYSCTKTKTVTHTGSEDELWEHRRVKSEYRILFDAADLQNAADFTGQSRIFEEDVMINTTSCG